MLIQVNIVPTNKTCLVCDGTGLVIDWVPMTLLPIDGLIGGTKEVVCNDCGGKGSRISRKAPIADWP